MSYFRSITQNVTISADNSSITPLNSGDTFAGSTNGESTLGIAAIQVTLKADQNATVYVEQSPDTAPVSGAPHWDISDVFYYYTTRNFGVTVQAVNSYVRVRVTNTSATNMTYMRLQTALCPIVEAVPRALSSEQRLETETVIADDYGWTAECTPFDELRTIEPVRLVGSIFTDTTLDANFWTATLANGGTATPANGQLPIKTNTTANGSAIIQSVRTARYVGANANSFRAAIDQTAGTADNVRRWGAFTATDGCFFYYNGVQFGVVTRRTNSANDIVVYNGNFNGELGATIDAVGVTSRLYEIYWTSRQVYFVLDGTLIHTVHTSAFGGGDTTWTDTLHLPIRIENTNSNSSTTSVTMNCRGALIYRLGPLTTDTIKYYAHGAVTTQVLKRGAGKVHRVVVNASGNGSTVTLYDSIGVASGQFAIVAFGAANMSPISLEYQANFYTGLTLTTVNASTDVTVVYE